MPWFDSSKRPLSLCILGGRLREVRVDFWLASDIFGGHVFQYNDPQSVTLDLEVDEKNLQSCIIRFRKSWFCLEFLNLVIHSCSFFKHCLKISHTDQLILALILKFGVF